MRMDMPSSRELRTFAARATLAPRKTGEHFSRRAGTPNAVRPEIAAAALSDTARIAALRPHRMDRMDRMDRAHDRPEAEGIHPARYRFHADRYMMAPVAQPETSGRSLSVPASLRG